MKKIKTLRKSKKNGREVFYEMAKVNTNIKYPTQNIKTKKMLKYRAQKY